MSGFQGLGFCYLDTNIFGIVISEPNLLDSLQEFLYNNNLCVAISDAQIIELCEVAHLFTEMSELISLLPSIMIKTSNMIIEEEVNAYPSPREEIYSLPLFNSFINKQFINGLISNEELKKARKLQQQDASQIWSKIHKLKPNYPLSDIGKYSPEQVELFSWMITTQWLAATHREFLQGIIDKGEILDSSPFQSILLFSHFVFYKYYIQNRKPVTSDFGDIFHLFSIPYCDWAIIERENCDIINEIKANHDIIKKTNVRNISLLKSRRK